MCFLIYSFSKLLDRIETDEGSITSEFVSLIKEHSGLFLGPPGSRDGLKLDEMLLKLDIVDAVSSSSIISMDTTEPTGTEDELS